MRSLIELKQTGTVAEYTAEFWEHLHPVLDLNPNLNIKGSVHWYVEGLREDIQAVCGHVLLPASPAHRPLLE
jgi:hypothetical protein